MKSIVLLSALTLGATLSSLTPVRGAEVVRTYETEIRQDLIPDMVDAYVRLESPFVEYFWMPCPCWSSGLCIRCSHKAKVFAAGGQQSPELVVPMRLTLRYNPDEAFPGNTLPVQLTMETFDKPAEHEFESLFGAEFGVDLGLRLFCQKHFDHRTYGPDFAFNIQEDFAPPLGFQAQRCEDFIPVVTVSQLAELAELEPQMEELVDLLTQFMDGGVSVGMRFDLSSANGEPSTLKANLRAATDWVSLNAGRVVWQNSRETVTVYATISPFAQQGQCFYLQLDQLRYHFYLTGSSTLGLFVEIWTWEKHYDHPIYSTGPRYYAIGNSALTLGPIEVTQARAYDLYPTDIGFSQDTPTDGEPVTITGAVMNDGVSYLEIPMEIKDNGQMVESRRKPGVYPHAVAYMQVNCIATPPGWHTVSLVVNPDFSVPETIKTNNTRIERWYVRTKPDLQVTAAAFGPTYAEKIREKDRTTITATVTNAGETASTWCLVRVTDTTDYQMIQTLTNTYVGPIAPGSSRSVVLTRDWRPREGGKYNSVRIEVDPDNQVSEHRENNNTFDASTYVNYVPDLYVSSITHSPTDPKEGDRVDATIVVKNGRPWETTNFVVEVFATKCGRYIHDSYVTNRPSPPVKLLEFTNAPLAYNQTTNLTVSMQTDSLSAHEHDLTAVVDVGEDVFEFDEGNNETTHRFYVQDQHTNILGRGWNFITLPNMWRSDYATTPSTNAQQFGEFVNRQTTNLNMWMLQRWLTQSNRWETYLMSNAATNVHDATNGNSFIIRELIMNLVKTGSRTNFPIEPGVGYRVFLSNGTNDCKEDVLFTGYLVEHGPGLPSGPAAVSRGWFADPGTSADTILRNASGAVALAKWSQPDQRWQFYTHRMNASHLGNLQVEKGEGYMLFLSPVQVADPVTIDAPMLNEMLTMRPDINFLTNGPWHIGVDFPVGSTNSLSTNSISFGSEPPLLSLGQDPDSTNKWQTVVSWLNLFNGLVTVSNSTATNLVIRLPAFTNARPDVAVLSSAITFSDDRPRDGCTNFLIQVGVTNIGGNTASNITVEVYSDDPDTSETDCWIGSWPVASLAAGPA